MPERAFKSFHIHSNIEQAFAIEVIGECLKKDNLLELDDIINGDFKDHENRLSFLKDLQKHLLENEPCPNIVKYLDV